MSVSFERIVRNFNGRIEEPVRKHLRNVYACLTMSAASAAVGTYVNIYAKFSAGLLSFLPSLGLLLALQFTPPNGKNTKLRLGYLLGFAFFAGIGLGPLVQYAIALDPSIIVSAFIGTILIFSCFTLSVLFAPRGYWLFLGGTLSTIISSLFFMSLANIFFQSTWMFELHIYVGLLLSCGFIMYDTTMIVEKCRMNNKDFVMHSLELLIDLISIFKKLIFILTEKKKNEKSRSKNY